MGSLKIKNMKEEEFVKLIKKAIKEAFYELKIDLILSNIPYVSGKEQKEIEEKYGKSPPKKAKIVYKKEIEI